jgi:predicted short-subunit dehydrogenase-like oxidoreductase (DUF2520 family)
MKVAIIGAGILGTSLGVLMKRAGHEVVAVASRTLRSAQSAASRIGGATVVGDPGLAPLGADVVLLAVPDRAIPSVAIQVAAGGALKRGAVVAHLSGALPAGVLAGVRAAGGWQGAMHPLQAFADVDTALTSLRGTFFFLEGDREAVDLLRTLVASLEGRSVVIEGASKSLYHAAACAASNYVVTLLDYATGLLVQAGVPPDTAVAALLRLVAGTVKNIEAVGVPAALTGPIARGDVGTIRGHLDALRRVPGDLVRVYEALARKTVEVALKKGDLGKDAAKQILDLLAGDGPPEGRVPPAPPGRG